MSNTPIPPEWSWVNLSSLTAELESGGRPKGGVRGITDGVPSIGGEHLTKDGGFDFSSIRYVPKTFADKLTRGWIKPEDILIVKDGATTGKTSFIDTSFPFPSAIVNEHVFRLRGNQNIILQKYLFYFLYSQIGQEMILSAFRGSAQGGINQGFQEAVDIPIPFYDNPTKSIETQSNIVQRLEGVLIEIRRAQDLHNSIGVNINSIFNIALENVIDEVLLSSPISLPLNDFGTAFNGRAGKSGKSEIRVYKTKHVYPFSLKDTDPSYLESDKVEKYPADRFLRKDDVLICNIGRGVLGRVCYVDEILNEKNTVDTSIMILRTDNRCLGNWLAFYLYSKRGQKDILAREKGIRFADLRGQTHLYPRDMLSVEIPLPPINIQQRIVTYLKAVIDETIEIKKAHKENSELLTQLKQSFLIQAFRGEL